jgi:protein-S-isoprenylcysteine O-methyltransferase Ste14
MALRGNLEKCGNWLFRWRSFSPLFAAPLLLLALWQKKALAGSAAPADSIYWELGAVLISFSGLAVRCAVAGYAPRGTSGRNTKWQAAETLNTKGLYSIVRNPLYLGNFLIVFGITVFMQVWWLALVVWLGFWAYYSVIIFTEEEFLKKKFGAAFLEWAEKTPKIIPRLRNWEKAELPFSFKAMLRREFSTFFAVIAVFSFLEVALSFLASGKLFLRLPWLVFFLSGFCLYWVFFILKKKTSVLEVPGR